MELRRKLHEIPIRDIRDVEAMATLEADARKKLEAAELLADAFIGVVFAADGAEVVETRLAALAADADRVVKGDTHATEMVARRAAADLAKDSVDGQPRHAFHWAVEFPDVFQGDTVGFDAIVGNPPFVGGRRISTVMGAAYNTFLAAIHPPASKNTDLVAHFFRRAFLLLRRGGTFGLLATKTIAEGDTRQGGLEWMIMNGAVIFAAYPNEPWPGKAAVVTSCIHVCKGEWSGRRHLSGRTVPLVSGWFHAVTVPQSHSRRKLRARRPRRAGRRPA